MTELTDDAIPEPVATVRVEWYHPDNPTSESYLTAYIDRNTEKLTAGRKAGDTYALYTAPPSPPKAQTAPAVWQGDRDSYIDYLLNMIQSMSAANGKLVQQICALSTPPAPRAPSIEPVGEALERLTLWARTQVGRCECTGDHPIADAERALGWRK